MLLDRYITKQFLKAIFFGLLAFSVIFILIDMIENLDDFPSPCFWRDFS